LAEILGRVPVSSCRNNTADVKSKTNTAYIKEKPVILQEKILSAEEQNAITPDMALESLKQGKARFIMNDASAGQYTIKEIRSGSAILKEMADGGQIKIVDAYYDFNSWEVAFLK
jgi:hypothetical protein